MTVLQKRTPHTGWTEESEKHSLCLSSSVINVKTQPLFCSSLRRTAEMRLNRELVERRISLAITRFPAGGNFANPKKIYGQQSS